MGYKRVETLGDVVRFGLLLKITCEACGRERRLPAVALYRRFKPSTALRQVGARLKCLGTDLDRAGCGHRGAVVDFILPTPPDDPPEGGGNVVSLAGRLWASAGFWDHAATRRRRRG